MSDMGILRVTMGVESHARRGEVRELADTMVDTGSEYTWIPRAVLESLGIGGERVERFVTADGRVIAREMGYAIVHAGGTRTSDEVVFAEPGDMVLLGAHTLEGMNLRVDLKEKRLMPAGPVPAAGVDARHGRAEPRSLALVLRETSLPLVNVNLPREPLGIRWSRQSLRHYDGRIVPDEGPMGRKIFWFTVTPIEETEEGTDRWAMDHGYVSITPLRLDLTDHQQLTQLEIRKPLD